MEEPIALLLRECTTCTHARLSSLNNRRFAFFRRLRKVKMDQRKLMDNASTITDMAKVSEPGTY